MAQEGVGLYAAVTGEANVPAHRGSATVIKGGTRFKIAGGAFADAKEPPLAAFYGLGSAVAWLGTINLFFSASGSPPSAFTSTLITPGTVLNAVAEPPVLALFGALLIGIGFLGRRRKIGPPEGS